MRTQWVNYATTRGRQIERDRDLKGGNRRSKGMVMGEGKYEMFLKNSSVALSI